MDADGRPLEYAPRRHGPRLQRPRRRRPGLDDQRRRHLAAHGADKPGRDRRYPDFDHARVGRLDRQRGGRRLPAPRIHPGESLLLLLGAPAGPHCDAQHNRHRPGRGVVAQVRRLGFRRGAKCVGSDRDVTGVRPSPRYAPHHLSQSHQQRRVRLFDRGRRSVYRLDLRILRAGPVRCLRDRGPGPDPFHFRRAARRDRRDRHRNRLLDSVRRRRGNRHRHGSRRQRRRHRRFHVQLPGPRGWHRRDSPHVDDESDRDERHRPRMRFDLESGCGQLRDRRVLHQGPEGRHGQQPADGRGFPRDRDHVHHHDSRSRHGISHLGGRLRRRRQRRVGFGDDAGSHHDQSRRRAVLCRRRLR